MRVFALQLVVQTPELRVPPVDVPLVIFYPDVDLSRKEKENGNLSENFITRRWGFGNAPPRGNRLCQSRGRIRPLDAQGLAEGRE